MSNDNAPELFVQVYQACPDCDNGWRAGSRECSTCRGSGMKPSHYAPVERLLEALKRDD